MPRAFILVLDSVGIGGAADAAEYGDEGADTVGHIAEACARGVCDRAGVRKGPLRLPHLAGLGLGDACRLATGRAPIGLDTEVAPQGRFGCALEASVGKDTQTGHWEIAGVPLDFAWGYFPEEVPCFPPHLIDALCEKAQLAGILGNRHASGTQIIAELGLEHMRSGKIICYTSADSVFQIAAHEGTFGLDRLYEVCIIARHLLEPYNIGRVIARPFIGTAPDNFTRTAHRRDYAVLPPAPTVLDWTSRGGRAVISVGKIGDIFAHSGTGLEVKADGNEALFDATLAGIEDLPDGGLLMTNFIDFDTLFGHRRDPAGYAHALESFDRRLPALRAALRRGDRVIITADHGCDPTWTGTDHTREAVPLLVFGPEEERDKVNGGIGIRRYSDIAASVAVYLNIPGSLAGKVFPL